VDFISGIEITPRFSARSLHDLKLFLIGHIGMTLWLLLNLNFVFFSYHQQHNFFTTLVLFALQAIYIFDWGWYEEWYLHTIDIKQDRLGWTLAYCPCNAIPCFYGSQCWFASSSHSPEISVTWTCCWAVAFLGFYWLFRQCNNQKDEFRKGSGKLSFCGRRLQGIKASFKGDDGLERSTLLLASGLWGQSRHFNYFMDLCMCLCLSFMVLVRPTSVADTFVPHTYTLLMTYILLARQMRDDVKCAPSTETVGGSIASVYPTRLFLSSIDSSDKLFVRRIALRPSSRKICGQRTTHIWAKPR
jgi:7-dehydrocholesterol reductase